MKNKALFQKSEEFTRKLNYKSKKNSLFENSMFSSNIDGKKKFNFSKKMNESASQNSIEKKNFRYNEEEKEFQNHALEVNKITGQILVIIYNKNFII